MLRLVHVSGARHPGPNGLVPSLSAVGTTQLPLDLIFDLLVHLSEGVYAQPLRQHRASPRPIECLDAGSCPARLDLLENLTIFGCGPNQVAAREQLVIYTGRIPTIGLRGPSCVHDLDLCVPTAATFQDTAQSWRHSEVDIDRSITKKATGTMSLNGTEAAQLIAQWKDQIVPRSFNAGFVTLSYVVSLIGAASTLELINRRTAPKGRINQYVAQLPGDGMGSLLTVSRRKACC